MLMTEVVTVLRQLMTSLISQLEKLMRLINLDKLFRISNRRVTGIPTIDRWTHTIKNFDPVVNQSTSTKEDSRPRDIHGVLDINPDNLWSKNELRVALRMCQLVLSDTMD